MRILDRYLIREIIVPFSLVLMGLTFALMMQPILQVAEQLIAKGVQVRTIVEVLITLVPQALGVTIPMALLLGILIGLGRVSADREFVAIQACGVSLFRLLRPLVLLAALATASTLYVMIVALPDANQRYREITFNVIASQSEGDVKPRVFFTTFPNRVIYVRDIPQTGGWRDVFLADSTHEGQSDVYFAQQGRLVIDRAKRTVMLVLEHGTRHTTYVSKPDTDELSSFDRLVLNMDADTVFPKTTIMKGDNEKTIAELRATIEEKRAQGQTYNGELFTIQQKFAIPVACIVFTLIGLALGITNRKDGKLAGFVLGIGVIFVYYIFYYAFRGVAMSGRMSPTFVPWIADIVLGIAGIVLVIWRAGSGDRPIRISLPSFFRWNDDAAMAAVNGGESSPTGASGIARRRSGVVLVIRVPHVDWPRPRLLDLYIARQYLMIVGLSFFALLGVFYISTFVDLVPHLYHGQATTVMLLDYFYWQTPQYVYFIIPLAVLVGTLVTVGMLTKSSELIVMRACGVSLYRSAVPVLLFGLVFSGVLFELEEHVLAITNREAIRLNAILRESPLQVFNVLDRRWIVGSNGDIYQYDLFDPQANRFTGFTMYRPERQSWRLARLVHANAVWRHDDQWMATNGWERVFTSSRKPPVVTTVAYAPFAQRQLSLEPPGFFRAEEPDADRMNYGELKGYITLLQASGSINVVKYLVDLQRKIAFPFVSLIMTLLAIPFAVTTGRRGAMYGIGAGLVLALVYWTMLSVFGALGAGGWISPLLAAWAPNILFGAAAIYLILTVRT